MKALYNFVLLTALVSILAACSSTNLPSVELGRKNIDMPSIKYVSPVGIKVDTTKCKASSITLTKKQFEDGCPYIGEASLTPDVTVRAVQDFPANEDENKIYLGQNLHLEFFKNGKKMEIPAQTFHVEWATDYLAIEISYVDDNHIYVEGSIFTEKPAKYYKYSYPNGGAFENVFTYFFNGKAWNQLIPQDMVHDSGRLQLFASSKYLKFINPRGCYYDPNTDSSGVNDKNGILIVSEYIIDANSYQLITKVDKKCSI